MIHGSSPSVEDLLLRVCEEISDEERFGFCRGKEKKG